MMLSQKTDVSCPQTRSFLFQLPVSFALSNHGSSDVKQVNKLNILKIIKMKNIYKAALLAALGMASVSAVQAQTYNGDLLVGFTIGTSGTDMIYDLGSAASVTDGESWSLSTALTAAGLQNSLATVQWGIIGSIGPSAGNASLNGTRFTYSTGDAGLNPVNGKNTWSAISGSTSTISVNAIGNNAAGNYGTVAATDPGNYSWYYETTGQPGNTIWSYHGGNTPNEVGLVSTPLYQTDANNTTPTVFDNGLFTLNANDTLTFAVVPEPTTIGLVTVAGLLLVAFRRKFASKQT
jgi:hypothetical protein